MTFQGDFVLLSLGPFIISVDTVQIVTTRVRILLASTQPTI